MDFCFSTNIPQAIRAGLQRGAETFSGNATVRSLTRTASMRRPVAVKQFFLWLKLCDLLGADQREAGCCPAPKAPFPSSQLSLRNGRNLSRARGLCAACEPLTDSFPSGTWIQRERGPGVSGGAPPGG